MNPRFAPALALSLVAAFAADAAVSSISKSTSGTAENAPAASGPLTVSNSATPVFTGTTTAVHTSVTLATHSPSRIQAGFLQEPAGTFLPEGALIFDQKLEPIAAIGITGGIQRASAAHPPAVKPAPHPSSR